MTDQALVDEYAAFHAKDASYGSTGHKTLPWILPHLKALKATSLIDYGCGKGMLGPLVGRRLGIAEIGRYDPAVPAFSARPKRRFDVLINVDVLEHIPEEDLDPVLTDMAAVAEHALLVIDTAPARTLLLDGRNAHVTLHGADWWEARLKPHFPTIRPMKIKRRARVAFKTFDDEVSPAEARMIRLRESAIVWGKKLKRLVLTGKI
ncbi:methyltransferase domain-containing protein [Brevundimonas denitrificans]|nr:methyltransferase domain-containing protein [Brevundimonas denitrificans]